jgi:uncharacterized protein YbgA (DUF1722 family)/uncharacterized protein YbbK (DUF523 family)
MNASESLRVGVSACLTGASLRFDGGHCRDPLVAALGRFVELVPTCPEVELGLGVPRETLRLERRDGLVELRTSRSGHDLTATMRSWSATRARALVAAGLDGFVVKRGSPSCGFERVRVHRSDGGPATRDGQGLFTAALLEADPLLVVEEEGRLRDAGLRENFLVRLLVGRRLRRLFAHRWRRGELVAFHASIKLELLAHAPEAYRALGRLVAAAQRIPPGELAEAYRRGVMEALAIVPSRGRHVNALEHIAGYVSERLEEADRRELQQAIEDYRRGREPRTTPLALLRHHVRRQGIAYLLQQSYLDTTPRHALGGDA